MILDNDDAKCRHGVEPTYKKVKGFGALQLSWGRFLIDSVFRGGSKHPNHEDTAKKMVRHAVSQIRKHYSSKVPIVICSDSGFFDQDLFGSYEEQHIGYIGTGELYKDIKHFVSSADPPYWGSYQNSQQVWDYLEFGDRRKSWNCFRRAFYLKPWYQDRQQLLDFASPDTVSYTNLVMDSP